MHVLLQADHRPKAKPQRRTFASSSTRTIPTGERTWTDIEPQKYSPSDYPMSKKLINLLRHGSLPRDNDGAIELPWLKEYLQYHFVFCHHWSDEKWKSSMAGGGHKKIFSVLYWFFRSSSVPPKLSKVFQDAILLILQDTVVIPDDFFQYIYHVGCAINLHSIINSGLTPGGQNLSNRQTVFFLFVDAMGKEHKDPDTIDLGAPRLAQYMHKAWKKHQNTVYWVDINLAIKKGLTFYQTRSNAIILHETLPAYCIPTVVRMETGEVFLRKSIFVTSTSSKDFLETWLDEGVGFRSCSTSRRRSCSTSRRLPTKPKSKSWWNGETRCLLRKHVPFSGKIDTRFSRDCKKISNLKEDASHDRKERPLCVPSFHRTSDVSTFHDFFWRFAAVRSFTADSGLLQPTGCVNTTPHTSIFSLWIYSSSVNLYKELSYRLKVNKFDALTTSELVSRHTERQAQQCVKWPETLGNLWA